MIELTGSNIEIVLNMTDLIRQHINIGKLNLLFSTKQYSESEKTEFVRYLDELLEEEVGSDEVLEDEDEILDFVCSYIQTYASELEKGYSIDWARQYADHLALEDENDTERAAALAFEAVMMVNPKKANKDLDLFIDSMGYDEFFKKHFVFLVEMNEAFMEPSVVNKSVIYSQIYKEQIQKGESELFANYFADLVASQDVTVLGCEIEAREFEFYVKKGFSEEIASQIAYELSEFIEENFKSYAEALDDESVKKHRRSMEVELQRLN